MKNILSIFKRDVNNIIKNRAAIVVILAVMILPSMYAWFNILPSWDPYANTEGISVAIVNLDEGAEVNGETINVGEEIVNSLSGNHKLGWDFVDEEKAMSGIEHGDYYASLVISQDFSEKLVSVLTDNPEKPVLDYYINEKLNAIAPKVTNSGASGIVDSIQKGFVKIANEAIFTVFNDIGIELEVNRGSIEKMRDLLFQFEADLPEIERLLSVADKDIAQVEKAIVRANDGMVKAKEVSEQAETLTVQFDKVLQEGDKAIRKYVPLAKQDLLLVQNVVQQVPEMTGRVTEKGEDIDEVLNKIEESTSRIDDTIKTLEQLSELLIEIDKKLTEDSPFVQLNNQLKEDARKIEALKGSIEKVIATLESGGYVGAETISHLNDLAKNIESRLEGIIHAYESSVLPKIRETIERLSREGSGVNDLMVRLRELEEQILGELERLKETAAKVSELTERLQKIAENPEGMINYLKDTVSRLENGLNAIQKIIQINERLQQAIDEGVLLSGAERIKQLQAELQNFKESIIRSVNQTRESKKNIDQKLNDMNVMASKMDDSITDLIRFLEVDLMEKYEAASEKANNALKEGNKMLAKANDYFPKVQELLGKAEDGIATGKEGLAKTNEVFPEVKDKVLELAKRIRELEEKGDLDQLINLMKNDPSAESDFFAEPILLETHELFPIPNYGSAMSPFFTTLSLWVGALILVSTLIPDVPNKHRYKSYEAYFGRLLLFLTIGLVQSFIVTMGDMFLLKTFVAHKFMFVLFGFIISTTFVVIVYTLVSVFGNSGKVVAIILLVMQLGASGGTFPIQMTPEFFQKVHAFMPFTHALNLLREAVGGIIWKVVLKHILWLVVYMAIFFFIGIKLKARINKSSDKFLEKARESELIL
ncbi:MAG TPA: YhgE/Pip domain-containing protein [Bacilli bacterium]|nr:YhgE/Pip domain-containing protein [Bacilli bacterium]